MNRIFDKINSLNSIFGEQIAEDKIHKMSARKLTVSKANGRIYTPEYIVDIILDLAGYIQENILHKHIIDNSCGDGAFLVKVVERYCLQALSVNASLTEIKQDLEKYIHGIEIDEIECKKSITRVSAVAEKYGVEHVNWDIQCANTLEIDNYNGKMDFVVGNPPYVRVHNLENTFDMAKSFSFAQDGMTDLYIVFYEIGLKMLNENGVLGYITPSSYFNSIAGSHMRKVFVENNLIDQIVDLKHFQAFNATTYTEITILKKVRSQKTVEYFQFDEKKHIPYYVETLQPDDFYIAGNFYFAKKKDLNLLKSIFFNLEHCDIKVKNGFATLCDDVYINNFDFNSEYIIPVIKASRGEFQRIIYPYDKTGKLIPEEKLKKDERLYNYLLSKKDILLNRSSEKKTSSYWFAFGRSQAINDTYKEKIAINSLLRTHDDLKILNAPSGTGVYSGLYIVPNTFDIGIIKKCLLSSEFSTYVMLLGKYKSGGYYTFSSKDIKAYLDYKLAYNGGIFQ